MAFPTEGRIPVEFLLGIDEQHEAGAERGRKRNHVLGQRRPEQIAVMMMS